MNEDLFKKYNDEIKSDLQIDDFNLKDKSMTIPSIKHKWVARLMEQKQELKKLKNLRRQTIDTIVQNLKDQEIVSVSIRTLEAKAQSHEVITKIDNEISNCENMVDYLEKIEKVMSQLTFDIRNLLEVRKQETT